MVELVAALALGAGPVPSYVAPSLAWGDARHAWAGGAGGIFATRNAGTTWRRVWRGEGNGLDGVDATHAWALSDNGVTIRTTDGVHWRSLGPQHLLRLSFVDVRNGFALDRDGFLFRTRDGGVSWTRLGAFIRLQSICFADARTGWVARGGIVWTTRDGGARWSRRTLVRARAGYPEPDLYCDGNDAWVVLHEGAGAGSEGYRIARSLDAGTTWRTVYANFSSAGIRISAYSGPIAALGRGRAILEGTCGPCGPGTATFVRTRDGGRTSARTTVPALFGGPLAFANARLGLALLTSTSAVPTIYRTRDGARSWRPVFASRRLR